MTSDDGNVRPVFNDEHRLHLLQLTARREIARRADVGGEGGRGARHGDDVTSANGPLPERWRLVPEGIELYQWQRECLPIWRAQGRGTIKVATGGGKTLFALAAAQALQNEREPDLRLVVVVPTIPLMFQWRDEVQQGNLPSSSVGLLGGNQDLPPLSNLRILIAVLNSARDKLPDLVRAADWSRRMLLVVDECHRSGAAQARQIFESAPRYTLGLSATPESEHDDGEVPATEAYEQGPVGQALGPVIYDFTLQQSLAAGLLTPFEIWHVGLPLSPPEATEHARLSREIANLRKSLEPVHRRSRSKQSFLAWCQTQASRGGSMSGEAERFIGLANQRKRLLYRAQARTEVCLGILSGAAADPDSRSIVFHESIEEIETLFLAALDKDLPAVLEHSKLPDGLRNDSIDAFRTGAARAIISAKSLVEGFNVPSADLGIIAASSSSVRQRIQSLGRMLRRKAGDRTARIYVLYVRDSEDEAIYERADWENVIGAEHNRYFLWQSAPEGRSWQEGLIEAAASPRVYRPPAREIDASALAPGDPYPAQSAGLDVRVDQDGNLRTEAGDLIAADVSLIRTLVANNRFRRGRITPARHLIARSDEPGSGEATWRFIGQCSLPEATAGDEGVRLRLRMVSGRRVIARSGVGRDRGERFALGPEKTSTPEAGEARDRLLAWIRTQESALGRSVADLYWDGKTRYWLEVEGNRIVYEHSLAPLEFSP